MIQDDLASRFLDCGQTRRVLNTQYWYEANSRRELISDVKQVSSAPVDVVGGKLSCMKEEIVEGDDCVVVVGRVSIRWSSDVSANKKEVVDIENKVLLVIKDEMESGNYIESHKNITG